MVSILHREMRIASRRPWTFRSRVITSALAFLCGVVLVVAGPTGRVNGDGLFSTLVFFSFWFSLIQGVRRAAGSIADEKREGTLGLLFLTDLKPIDIVLGKLSACAVPLIQPLLAFLPVLSISMLLGGTTAGEILRAALVLATALIYSISIGLVVSSFSRRSERTGYGTLVLIIISVFAPRIWNGTHLATPLTAYVTISDPGYRVSGVDFWWSLLITNLLSALFLLAAAFFLPRRWEDREIITPAKRAKLRITKSTEAKRAAILDRNPGEWLAVRHSIGTFERLFFTSFTLLLAIAAPIVGIAFGERGAGMLVIGVAVIVLILRLASQASYPLAEARRSGAIEMLSTTPLNPKCLITGQVTSLQKQFLPLAGLLFIASGFCVEWRVRSPETVATVTGILIFWGIATALAVEVAAFGIWMGLREKSPNAAFFKTILFSVAPLILFCLWPVLIVYYVGLFAVTMTQLTGTSLQRLISGEKRAVEMTPVAPIIPAPPIIRQ
jgi:ABC-type transport system involved in cytochrome c biogenesis permease component